MASKPALVLVPGMCSVGRIVFAPLVQALKQKHGFQDITVVDLPSVDAIETGASLEPSGLHADIDAVRQAIEKYLSTNKDVVVIGHSYGGSPSLYGIGELWKSRRNGGNGVTKAILVAASLTLPGGTVAGDREEYKSKHGGIDDGAPNIQPYGKDIFIIPTGFEHVWMTDIADQEIRNSLKPSPLSTVMTPTPEGTTRPSDWDIAYLVTKGDAAMPENFMRGLAKRAQEVGAKVEIEEMESGHFVQISHADEVAEWISQVVV